MRSGIIPEPVDKRVIFEGFLHHGTLYTLASPVYQPHLSESGRVSCCDVLLHHVNDITRRERVQVKRIFNRKFVHKRGF